ncbi:hypothetical protein Bxe_B0719 [Paraburkholderia xenovorans LB400]|uniref:Uncharacterized protein n=1 Tax=Paraburkholderia xenovorans (strain LB400) TaxID=266265 RepID=Q13L04_PARXL|nr:hypothetical protein Bxe_B0719 [Paraburkholderia xenovorans LB400]
MLQCSYPNHLTEDEQGAVKRQCGTANAACRMPARRAGGSASSRRREWELPRGSRAPQVPQVPLMLRGTSQGVSAGALFPDGA